MHSPAHDNLQIATAADTLARPSGHRALATLVDFLVALTLAAGGVAILGARWWQETGRDSSRVRAVWQDVAARHGGVAHQGAFGARYDELRIPLPTGTARISFDHAPGSRTRSLRAVVDSTPPLPAFEIQQRGRFTRGATRSLARILELSEQPVAANLIVESYEPVLFEHLWSPTARAHLTDARLPRIVALSRTGQGLVLRFETAGHDPGELDAAIGLMQELVRPSLYGEEALESLDGPLEWAENGLPRVTLRSPCGVQVGPEVCGRALCTVVRLLEIGPERDRGIVVRADAEEADESAGALSPGARSWLRKTVAGTLEVTARGHVSFEFDGLETHSKRLEAAVALLHAVYAAGPGSVYR